MGVKDLWRILSPVEEEIELKALRGKQIAVDLSIWICESDSVKQMQGTVVRPYLRTLFFRIVALLQLDILPVFVIEGKAPQLKHAAIARRQGCSNSKGTRSQLNSKIKQCCILLDAIGVPYFQATGEAEATCACLNQLGYVDGCVTEDSDVLLYGARTVIKDFSINSKNAKFRIVKMSRVEKELGYSRETLIGMALLLGSDYACQGVHGVGKEMVTKLIQEIPKGKSLLYWLRNFKRPNYHPRGRAEDAVYHRAKIVPRFPDERIIEEFMHGGPNAIPPITFQWAQPMFSSFLSVSTDLMEWRPTYARQKIIPLLSLWNLKMYFPGMSACRQSLLIPTRIMKSCVRQGVASLEVQWQRLGCDDLPDKVQNYLTVENAQLIESYYPDMYRVFQKEKKKPEGKEKMLRQAKSEIDPASKEVDSLINSLTHKLNLRPSDKMKDNSLKLLSKSAELISSDTSKPIDFQLCSLSSISDFASPVIPSELIDLTKDEGGSDIGGRDIGGRDTGGSDELGRDTGGSDELGRDIDGSDQNGSDQLGKDQRGKDQCGRDQRGIKSGHNNKNLQCGNKFEKNCNTKKMADVKAMDPRPNHKSLLPKRIVAKHPKITRNVSVRGNKIKGNKVNDNKVNNNKVNNNKVNNNKVNNNKVHPKVTSVKYPVGYKMSGMKEDKKEAKIDMMKNSSLTENALIPDTSDLTEHDLPLHVRVQMNLALKQRIIHSARGRSREQKVGFKNVNDTSRDFQNIDALHLETLPVPVISNPFKPPEELGYSLAMQLTDIDFNTESTWNQSDTAKNKEIAKSIPLNNAKINFNNSLAMRSDCSFYTACSDLSSFMTCNITNEDLGCDNNMSIICSDDASPANATRTQHFLHSSTPRDSENFTTLSLLSSTRNNQLNPILSKPALQSDRDKIFLSAPLSFLEDTECQDKAAMCDDTFKIVEPLPAMSGSELSHGCVKDIEVVISEKWLTLEVNRSSTDTRITLIESAEEVETLWNTPSIAESEYSTLGFDSMNKVINQPLKQNCDGFSNAYYMYQQQLKFDSEDDTSSYQDDDNNKNHIIPSFQCTDNSSFVIECSLLNDSKLSTEE